MPAWIPMTNEPRQSFTTVLGRQEVRVNVWWQPLDSHWYFSLEYPLNTPVVSGRRILQSTPLVGIPSTFTGEIECLPLEVGIGEPGRNAWDTTHALVYLD